VSEENQKLLTFVNQMNLPAGYTTKTGGVNEENQKSVQSILQAMLLSSILILITMVVQFQSFRKAIIVLMVIPLAVSSVFLAFALLGIPLSFPALIGVLSLFGIVVTNSMFIVDKINLNMREGMQYTEAIADAGASRLEPIILTKLTAVFGLLPITLADALWQGLGGAIISGLLVASSIMLFFIPVVYYIWMKKE
ncbi:efflux RND transporter permease subunit, partial [Candidatus Microgenomates bacterium]|nr:efflux RND transporter permease subunit [Candidatus Microgenomates bacterium]